MRALAFCATLLLALPAAAQTYSGGGGGGAAGGMATNASNATLPTAMTNLAASGMTVGGAIQMAISGTVYTTWTEHTTSDPFTALTYNQFNIPADDYDASGGQGVAIGQTVELYPGGTSTKGNRVAIAGFNKLIAAPATGRDDNYTALWGYTHSGSFDQSGKGAFFGSNPQVQIGSGSNVRAAVGEEIDVANDGTTTAVIGLNIAKAASDSAQGSSKDYALAIGSATGTTKWKNGVMITNLNGIFPLSADATVIGADTAGTVAKGVDFSNLTFTGNVFDSPHFSVNSSGTVISSAANGGFFQAASGSDETFILDTASASQNNNIYWRSNGNAKFQAGINAGNVFTIYDIVNNAAAFTTDTSGNTTIGEPTHSTTVLGSLISGTTSSTPVHHVTAQTTAPALTSCGGGSPAITGTDTAGIVTMGTTATGCVITFNVAYASAPYCVVSWIATPLASQSYATSNTAITLTQTSTSGNKVQYICIGQAGG